MTKPTSTRAMAGQNLIVASVNTALTRRLIALECELATQASFEFTLDGHPVIAYVNDAGFDEVSVHAICRPTELGHEFIECAVLSEWRRFGEATVYSWLERRSGKYLQSTSEYHGTKEITAALGALVVEPLGFGTKPIKGGHDWHLEFESVFGLARKRSGV
jgi:hypothetical protein